MSTVSPMGDPAGTTESAFTAAVSAITDAFGDPTRRRVYLYAREHGGTDGVTVSVVATAVGVHPNVARHHLDKLAAGGYIQVVGRDRGPAPADRRAGRPSKRYVATSQTMFEAALPVRSDDLVLALLGQALDRLPQEVAEAMAEEVGATYGRAMAAGLTGDALAAGRRSLRSAMQAVADALTAHGFAAHTAATKNRGLRIINEHCPFGTVANDHPVICAVDRGMVRGMLGVLHGGEDVAVSTEASKARGDTFCATGFGEQPDVARRVG